MTQANESAFPIDPKAFKHDGGRCKPIGGSPGLTKRYYFAAKAMQSFLLASFQPGGAAALTDVNNNTSIATPEHIAKASCVYSDALLSALSQTQPSVSQEIPEGVRRELSVLCSYFSENREGVVHKNDLSELIKWFRAEEGKHG